MLAETGDPGSAAQDYARVREMALQGAPDPLGLAVASYGQQARLSLTGSLGQCAYEDVVNATPCLDAIAPANLHQAVRLYAAQAARDSISGRESLRLIADWALASAARAGRLIDDPVGQRLLVAYGLARIGDIVDGKPDSARDPFANFEQTGRLSLADAAGGAPNVAPNPALQSLVAALQTQDPQRIADADRVAALAYRVGRYDLAQTLAERLDTALAWWVRAKLAIRRGDNELAAQAYARAIAAFPRADGSLEPGSASCSRPNKACCRCHAASTWKRWTSCTAPPRPATAPTRTMKAGPCRPTGTTPPTWPNACSRPRSSRPMSTACRRPRRRLRVRPASAAIRPNSSINGAA
ncbi:hypothetical protein WJ971_00750 [Achromobacter xylosoxidans]